MFAYRKHRFAAIGLFGVLSLTFLVYYPGLFGGYLFDDEINILLNDALRVERLDPIELRQAALSGNSGPLGRPVSMMSFALNYRLTGLDPFYFKLANLFIHLLNGAGLFVLSNLLLTGVRRYQTIQLTDLRIKCIGFIIASVWLLHPLAITSVLYIVQRMTSLAALFQIAGLIFYVWARMRLDEGRSSIVALVAGTICLTLISALSKENGVLLPVYALCIEAFLFAFRTRENSSRWLLIAFFVLVVLLPILVAAGALVVNPESLLGGYRIRDFTLVERLLTQTRLLWFYLSMIVFPNNQQLGLFHDDVIVSHSLTQPLTTLVSVVAIVAAIVVSFALRRRLPVLAFGGFFFLAGHALESTIFPLELAHEHRNYLPMYGILFVVVYYFGTLLDRFQNRFLRIGVAVVFVLSLAATTAIRVSYWGNPLELAVMEAKHHPNSARTNYEAGREYSRLLIITAEPQKRQEYYTQASAYFQKATSLSENYTNGLVGLIVLSYDYGVIPNDDSFAELERRLRVEPFAGNNVTLLGALIHCQRNARCKIPQQRLVSLLRSALQNPTLHGATRAGVLTVASNLLANDLGNYTDALGLSREAVNANPGELQWRLNLANLLIAMNRFDEAQKELSIVRTRDRFGAYSLRIQKQQEFLHRTRSLANHDPVLKPTLK
ncbi:MAG: tetratricopeptide repeat protein [Gammaproteobacteria bacterium]